MTNLSLKEQLAALSTVLPNNPETSSPKKEHKPKIEKNKATKPAWLESVKYGVELLKAHYPLCFKEADEIKPVKVGIKQDLVKDLSSRDDIVLGDKACMVSSLAYYVGTMSYHKQVVKGATRIDLHGQPAGEVTEQEAAYSATAYQAKKQRKNLPRK